MVQGRRVGSPSGWSMRTLQGDNVVLEQVGAYTGRWSVCLVAAGKQGVGASFRLELEIRASS